MIWNTYLKQIKAKSHKKCWFLRLLSKFIYPMYFAGVVFKCPVHSLSEVSA